MCAYDITCCLLAFLKHAFLVFEAPQGTEQDVSGEITHYVQHILTFFCVCRAGGLFVGGSRVDTMCLRTALAVMTRRP